MNEPTFNLLTLFRRHPGMETLLYIAQPFRLQRLNQILRGGQATSEEIQVLLDFLNTHAQTHYTGQDLSQEHAPSEHPSADLLWLEDQIQTIALSLQQSTPPQKPQRSEQ